MIKVASIAISSLFAAQKPAPVVEAPREQAKVGFEQQLIECLKPKSDLPAELLEFCSSFDPNNFSSEVEGSVGCYMPPLVPGDDFVN